MNTICWRRAWEILQEMRWVLKDIAGVEVASPGRETTDLEGRIVKDRVRNIQERQTALTDSARAIRGYRKLANQPLTLRGSSIGADLFGIVENLLMLAEELIVMWANDNVRFPQFSRVVGAGRKTRPDDFNRRTAEVGRQGRGRQYLSSFLQCRWTTNRSSIHGRVLGLEAF